jgi:hypothetical protein
MAAPLKGSVHGNTVVLDDAVPPLEGKRVRSWSPSPSRSPLGREQNLEACVHVPRPARKDRSNASPNFRDCPRRHALTTDEDGGNLAQALERDGVAAASGFYQMPAASCRDPGCHATVMPRVYIDRIFIDFPRQSTIGGAVSC